ARLDEVELAALVVTAIERDGMLGGPDVDGLAHVLAVSRHPVVASGGVASASDLQVLAGLERAGRRLAGAIVGKALVDGVLGIEEAVRACEASV
ncbi:MAG TPA: HisA/HisF-related TIM barrel protein, partial [Acidimicrobiales bacterium]|nr:HisA/HisF-related TIM barrel protein [Acidimicrobiales bacterium]